MTAKGQRQIVLLGGLVAILGLVLLWRFGGDSPAETPQPPSNRAGRTEKPVRRDVPVGDVKLESLHREPVALPDAERNPFQFRPKPAPPPPPRAAVMRPPPRPEISEAPPPPAGPPPPPPIGLKFFGLTVVKGVRVAMFHDGRGSVFHGKEGDIIEGRYRISRIGPDSAELSYLDGRGRQTIRLSGQ